MNRVNQHTLTPVGEDYLKNIGQIKLFFASDLHSFL